MEYCRLRRAYRNRKGGCAHEAAPKHARHAALFCLRGRAVAGRVLPSLPAVCRAGGLRRAVASPHGRKSFAGAGPGRGHRPVRQPAAPPGLWLCPGGRAVLRGKRHAHFPVHLLEYFSNALLSALGPGAGRGAGILAGGRFRGSAERRVSDSLCGTAGGFVHLGAPHHAAAPPPRAAPRACGGLSGAGPVRRRRAGAECGKHQPAYHGLCARLQRAALWHCARHGAERQI